MVVTFDLFSAMTNSRQGGGVSFSEIAKRRMLTYSGHEIYDCWDSHNKSLQRTAQFPTTFRDLSLEALSKTYFDLGLEDSWVSHDFLYLENSVGKWPLWPDISFAIKSISKFASVGLLSNVDNSLAEKTQAYQLIDPTWSLTSERLASYKPDPAIYKSAVSIAAPLKLVHIAASARDVRGALEAGITTIRLARPGHKVDERDRKSVV